MPENPEQNSYPKVLIVAYWFPPAGGIAVQRALSLVKYLPACGFEVHVLAPKNPPAPVLDPALLRHIPAGVHVHRAVTPMPPSHWRARIWKLVSRSRAAPQPAAATGPAPEASVAGGRSWQSRVSDSVRGMLCPDPEVVWYPFALRKASRIIRRHGIQAVIVTAPPFSLFLLGNALKRRFPKVRYISDFRDDWLRFFLTTFEFHSSDAIRRRAARIELETVTRSDAIVLVTPRLLTETRERYPGVDREKFTCIPNGYDPEIFANFRSRRHNGPQMVVTYVGTVYKTTSPQPYFAALARLPEEIRDGIETRFVGRITDEEQALLGNCKAPVKVLGFVPQSEALRYMEETDFLLVTMADPTAATGKVYEYLATGKPILAISPKGGEIDLMLHETGAGWCAAPDDPAGIADMLRSASSGDFQLQRNEEAIRRYERPQQAFEFGKLIHSCLASDGLRDRSDHASYVS